MSDSVVEEKYVGDMKEDKFNGNGTFYYANGDVYIGSWLDNTRSGEGKYIFANGDVFEGEFIGDILRGPGTFSKDGQVISGIFLDGAFITEV